MPTTYDFYMCDAASDAPDELIFEEMYDRVLTDHPELSDDAKVALAERMVSDWLREQADMY